MTVESPPKGYHTVTPYLVVDGVVGLIDFLCRVFGAIELQRTARPDGSVQHARVRIGDSHIMMGEPQNGANPMPAILYVYVNDVDATFERALAAGAESVRRPETQFYGDRNAGVRDACGNEWWMAKHEKDVSADDLQRLVAVHRPSD